MLWNVHKTSFYYYLFHIAKNQPDAAFYSLLKSFLKIHYVRFVEYLHNSRNKKKKLFL